MDLEICCYKSSCSSVKGVLLLGTLELLVQMTGGLAHLPVANQAVLEQVRWLLGQAVAASGIIRTVWRRKRDSSGMGGEDLDGSSMSWILSYPFLDPARKRAGVGSRNLIDCLQNYGEIKYKIILLTSTRASSTQAFSVLSVSRAACHGLEYNWATNVLHMIFQTDWVRK